MNALNAMKGLILKPEGVIHVKICFPIAVSVLMAYAQGVMMVSYFRMKPVHHVLKSSQIVLHVIWGRGHAQIVRKAFIFLIISENRRDSPVKESA